MEKLDLYTKIVKCDFEKLFKKKGYAFFTQGCYNLNIIGIRRAGNVVTNIFDDYLVLIYNTNTPKGGIRQSKKIYSITTDPGITYMHNPISKEGTAILVPGQYREAYKIGLHKGSYKALIQNKPLKVYRDSNKDDIYDWDENTIKEGFYGINIHKAGTNSKKIDNWSAGCQVFANVEDFMSFMKICNNQIKAGYGDTFTYTLLREEDLYE